MRRRRRTCREQVLETREGGVPLKQQAVLFPDLVAFGAARDRTDAPQHPFVKFGGLKFLDAAHIKDLLALLRWAENPRDRVGGLRVLQLLPAWAGLAGKGARRHGQARPMRMRRCG